MFRISSISLIPNTPKTREIVKNTHIYAKTVNKKRDDAIGLIDREFAET